MKFLIGFTLAMLAQTLTFVQLQGQFKYNWMKDNPFIVSLIGIPISLMYLLSVKYLVSYFEGQLWPSRLLGFTAGAIVFTCMAHYWFQEPFTTKTGVCLFLSLCIMAIQLLWK
jgi:hypothetical protein